MCAQIHIMARNLYWTCFFPPTHFFVQLFKPNTVLWLLFNELSHPALRIQNHCIWILKFAPIFIRIRAFSHIANFEEKKIIMFSFRQFLLFLNKIYENNDTWRKFSIKIVNFCPSVQPFPPIFNCADPDPYSK